ncbi:hypothetical protein FHW83_004874 [Duganella sp. SG902]|nr:hypothetical protein [Duganella sp. SG902]
MPMVVIKSVLSAAICCVVKEDAKPILFLLEVLPCFVHRKRSGDQPDLVPERVMKCGPPCT